MMIKEAGPEKQRLKEFVVGFTWMCDSLIRLNLVLELKLMMRCVIGRDD